MRHYDQFGNVIELDGLGDPQDATDDRTATTKFLPPNSPNYLVAFRTRLRLKTPQARAYPILRLFMTMPRHIPRFPPSEIRRGRINGIR